MIAPRIAIVGGGIAGLSIAHALGAQVPDGDVVVLEGGDRVGGNIRSDTIDGYVCEAGPDGFLDNVPATLELVDAVGLTPAIVRSRDEARRRYIYRHGRLHEVPLSPSGFMRTRLLSTAGKLRVMAEPFAPGIPNREESILEFAARHIGREAATVLVGSMVSGVFAGDASQLSLRAAFPKMFEMEAEYGSLVRAMIAKRRRSRNENGIGAPAGTLTSFAGGMETLVRGVASALGGRVRTGCRVEQLEARNSSEAPAPRPVGARDYSVECNGRRIEADAVVLAAPANQAAALVQRFCPGAAGELAAIASAPLAVVCLGFDQAALAAERGPLDGFGFLVPRGEDARILGALWETSIYPDRAPAGKALVRVMIGGATDPAAVGLSDAELLDAVGADLEKTMGLRLVPEFVHIVRHWRGIPQYTIGHGARLARIEAALAPHRGLFLAGNAYRGVSINACVDDAKRIAGNIADYLRTINDNGRGRYLAIR